MKIETIKHDIDPNEFLEITSIQQEFAFKFLNLIGEIKDLEIFKNDPLLFNFLKSYCYDLASLKIPALNITDYKYNTSHLRFSRFIKNNFDNIINLSKRTDVLKLYSVLEDKTILFLVNDLISSQHSFSVKSTADFVLQHYPFLLEKKCFEVAAGTSPLSKWLSTENKPNYIVSDLRKEYLQSNSLNPKFQYDLNTPLEERDIHCILSTKSIHLAKNKVQTINYLADALVPEGYLIVSHANKYIAPSLRHPFEFAPIFVPGFVEVGGFIQMEDYLNALYESKLTPVHVCIYENQASHQIYWVVAAQKI